MFTQNDFTKFALSQGISSNKVKGYADYSLKNSIMEPYILEEREMNCQPMSVFSRLLHDRIIFLGSDINSDVADIMNAQMLYLNSVSDDDIKLFINSGGGSTTCGMAIYDVMNFITPDVSTYCMGMCASMAAVILSSGAKGKRYSLPHGEIMIHQVSSGIDRAQCADIQIMAESVKKTQNVIYTVLSENTGKTFEEIEKDADRDHWMDAVEALNYGIIDKVIKKGE